MGAVTIVGAVIAIIYFQQRAKNRCGGRCCSVLVVALVYSMRLASMMWVTCGCLTIFLCQTTLNVKQTYEHTFVAHYESLPLMRQWCSIEHNSTSAAECIEPAFLAAQSSGTVIASVCLAMCVCMVLAMVLLERASDLFDAYEKYERNLKQYESYQQQRP